MIQVLPASSTVTWDVSTVENRVEGVQIAQFTPTADCTINVVPDGLPGQLYVLEVITSGTNSYTITFGSNIIKTGTLATGTTSARYFSVTFYSDGKNLIEMCRTAVAS